MKSYYSFNDTPGNNSCNRVSAERPIIVNCAGKVDTEFPFTTDNPTGRDDYYMLYMVRGELSVELSGETVTADSGTVIIFPPKYPYRYFYRGGEPILYFWIHFTGGYVQQLLKECGICEMPWQVRTAKHSKMADHFRRFYDRFMLPEPFLSRELACALEQLILTVAQSANEEPQKRPLSTSLDLIHASYQKPLTVEELAQIEHLSQSRYITLFKEQYGMPPIAYIINLRMLTACELLLGTDMSVKQIGIQVGYDDPFFFSKIFKRHMGASPQSYRALGGQIEK
ncbi:MAG: helix-turn-helix domain-containing protein [Clostridia bacterium]|nr:helix-turn-helix domain-containing protein [Clostridia bacterium]